MGRWWWLVLVVALVVAGRADAAGGRCSAPRHYHAAEHVGRVQLYRRDRGKPFVQQLRVYACDAAVGRNVLAAKWDDLPTYTFVIGSWVTGGGLIGHAESRHEGHGDAVEILLQTRSLRTGRAVCTIDAGYFQTRYDDSPGFARRPALRVRLAPGGGLVSRTTGYPYDTPPRPAVDRVRNADGALLDEAPAGQLTHLLVADGQVSWRHGAEDRSAPLAQPACARVQ